MNKNVIIAKDDKGLEVEYEILFEFYDENSGKNYVGYTDNKTDEFGNILVYASTFDKTLKDKYLYPIETDEEWDIIETIFSKLPDMKAKE